MPPQGHMTEDHTLVVTHTTNSQKSLIKKVCMVWFQQIFASGLHFRCILLLFSRFLLVEVFFDLEKLV